MQITVSPEAFEKAVQGAYLKNRSRFSIPGFRKGKAPRKIIEQQYGVGVFYDDAINALLPEYYGQAIDELAIEPVDRPDVDIVEIEKGKPFVFTAEVAVRPEVELGEYKGVEVEKITVEVTDEQIQDELTKSQEMNSRMVTVDDRPVADGDIVTIDYKGFVGEDQFDGGTADNHELTIGSGQFIPGFEEQLIGAELNSDAEVNVTFPEDYHSEDLAGKEAVFKVAVKGIKVKELPELDDEFAKDTSEFDTLEELKANIKEEMTEAAERNAELAQRDKVIDKVIENMTVEIPDAMVNTEIDGMLRDFDYQLQAQGLNLEQYVKFTGGSLDALKEQMKGDALTRVKTGLAIEAVAKAENIEVADEDLDAELERIAEIQKQEVEEVKKMFAQDNYAYLRENLASKKTVDFLVENAKLV